MLTTDLTTRDIINYPESSYRSLVLVCYHPLVTVAYITNIAAPTQAKLEPTTQLTSSVHDLAAS